MTTITEPARYVSAEDLLAELALVAGQQIAVRYVDRRYLFILSGSRLFEGDKPVRHLVGQAAENIDSITDAGEDLYDHICADFIESGLHGSLKEIWFGGQYFVRIQADPADIETYYRSFATERLDHIFIV